MTRLADVRERAAVATPGPWMWFTDSRYGDYLATPDRGRLFILKPFRKGMQGATVRFRGGPAMREGVDHPDAVFIAHARDDVDHLLRCVDHLLGEVRELVDLHVELVNDVLERAPEAWDDDVAAEHIAVEYVRHLEAEVDRLGGRRFPFADGESEDGS